MIVERIMDQRRRELQELRMKNESYEYRMFRAEYEHRKAIKRRRKKMTYLEKMGLEPVKKLSKKICKERVKHLTKLIDRKKVRGKLRERAIYYKNWYAWQGRNGGNRAA